MIKYSSDSMFVQGSSHLVCQDYAVNGIASNARPYAILADGCSGSPNTDIGARLLAQGMSTVFKTGLRTDTRVYGADHYQLYSGALARAYDALDALGMADPIGGDQRTLDATLLSAWYDELVKQVNVCVRGDGYYFWSSSLGVQGMRFVYPSGAPDYLTYGPNTQRRQSYLNLFPAKVVVSSTILGFPDGALDPEPVWDDIRTFDITQSCSISGYSHSMDTVDKEHGMAGIDWLVMFSDGLGSFRDAGNRPVSDIEVIKLFLPFKNTRGEFVQRRMHAFLKETIKRGWHHYDDIACAGIAVNADSTPEPVSPACNGVS